MFFRQLRDMPALTEGVGASHNDRILVKQISQFLERKEMSFFFVGFQPPVKFQNRLHGADGQNVSALGDVGFHSRKDPQPVEDEGISLSLGMFCDKSVQPVKSQRVEMFCQAQGVKSCLTGF